LTLLPAPLLSGPQPQRQIGPLVGAAHWQRKTKWSRVARVRIRSGGREPAVGVSIALARALPLSHAGPPRVCMRMAGAFALSGTAKGRLLYQRRLSVIFSRCARVQGCHGGLTPPALVLVYERLSAKTRFLRCTNARRKRAAGVSPPWLGKRACNTDTAHVRRHSSRAETIAAGVSSPWAWVTHLQRRFRKVAGDCRHYAHERSRTCVI
jgi:hypothetical protein